MDSEYRDSGRFGRSEFDETDYLEVIRDAKKYDRLISTLFTAAVEIRQFEREDPYNIDEILERLLPKLADALSARKGFVALVDESSLDNGSSTRLELKAVHPAQDDLRGQTIELPDRYKDLVAEGQRKTLNSESRTGFLSPLDVKSAVLVRMETIGEARIVGVADHTDDHPGAERFLASDGQALDDIVEFIAIGARMGGRREREMDSLRKIAAALSESLELRDVLDTIIRQIEKVTDCQMAAVFLVDDEDATSASLAVSRGLSENFRAAAMNLPISPGTRMEVIHYKTPIAVEDVHEQIRMPQYGDMADEYRAMVDAEGIRAFIDVPMNLQYQIVGAITAYYEKSYEVTRHEEKLLMTFASYAALAVRNAREHEKLRKSQGLVGARGALAWMGMVSTAWRHRIHNYAIVIRDDLEFLLNSKAARDFNRQTKKIVRTSIELANQIIESPITPPLSPDEGVDLIPVSKFIKDRIEDLLKKSKYSGVKVKLNLDETGLASVLASPDWLQTALDILFDNAVRAIKEIPDGLISISTHVKDGEVEIHVMDNGKGIPPEVLEVIFEGRPDPEDYKEGLHMGLLMAQAIAHAYKGELTVLDPDPGSTTLNFCLPQGE